jgi:hypothetical protein
MVDDATRQARLVVLRQELGAIHSVNQQYWNRKEYSHEADMDLQLRQERLEHIRKEMDELEDR